MGIMAGTRLSRWTQEECDTLLAMREQNASYESIAAALGRTATACQAKAFYLGMGQQRSAPDSIEEMARKNYDTAVAQLDGLEVRRGVLLSEMAKAMKVLVALGLEDEKHMCAKCGQEFVRKGDLTAHVNREHPVTMHVGEGVVS